MSRAWRIEDEGALYHVLSRGNDQSRIVIDDEDRLLFMDTLAQMSDRFEIDIFAYVLMVNKKMNPQKQYLKSSRKELWLISRGLKTEWGLLYGI